LYTFIHFKKEIFMNIIHKKITHHLPVKQLVFKGFFNASSFITQQIRKMAYNLLSSN